MRRLSVGTEPALLFVLAPPISPDFPPGMTFVEGLKKEVAREPGIHASQLYRWRQELCGPAPANRPVGESGDRNGRDLDSHEHILEASRIRRQCAMPELIGSIIAYGGEIDPTRLAGWEATRDWMLCNGRELPIRDYSALHDAIGIAWGGDEKGGKFNLPDLRGYFLRGVDAHLDQLVDPDRDARTWYSSHSQQRKGPNVGSFQSFATALPPISITKVGSAHIHSLRFQLNAGRMGASTDNTVAFPGLHDPMGTNEPFVVHRGHGDIGEHTHGITTDGNKEKETRPVNAYVHWLIRYR